MDADFRTLVEDLRAADALADITGTVDIRKIPALVSKAEGQALMFHDVDGYDMPVVSGVTNSRESLAVGLRCDYAEIEGKISRAIDNPIAPRIVKNGPVREVLVAGDDVDLCALPVPLCSLLDGGPMITAGLTIAVDDQHGLNAGFYRYLIRERNVTGIDLVTPNNLRRFADKAFAAGKPLPISINLGTHMYENMCATFPAPIGTNELAVAGGFREEAVSLTPCETIDAPCIADAEIVLEAEILPTGWTQPEGRFGEFSRLMGGLHWNPHVRIKAISMRKNPIYYALHMPWEVIWLLPPLREAALRRAMKEANIDVVAINATPGSSCFFHAVISIRKQPGDGKNAIMAALSGAGGAIKHVVIVDDDIDIFDAMEVEWAIATRVQADRDVMIVPGARSKPLDPSIPPVGGGMIPTTAKMGIDATIPDNVPAERYDRIEHPYADELRLADYFGNATVGAPARGNLDIETVAGAIREMLADGPRYYAEISDLYAGESFQTVSRAIVWLQESNELWQDDVGRLCLKDSPAAARPPTRK